MKKIHHVASSQLGTANEGYLHQQMIASEATRHRSFGRVVNLFYSVPERYQVIQRLRNPNMKRFRPEAKDSRFIILRVPQPLGSDLQPSEGLQFPRCLRGVPFRTIPSTIFVRS